MERITPVVIQHQRSGVIAGTIGGTLFSLFGSLNPEDMMKTMVLAAIGAVTSFVVSLILKRFFKGTAGKEKSS